jgi:hypothetical protein
MRSRLGHHSSPGRCLERHHQGGVPAIEHAKPETTELRTVTANAETLGGRLETFGAAD